MPETKESLVDAQVIDNPEQHRFELPIEGGSRAVAYYELLDGRVILRHTEVPQEYSGQGIGSRLANGVFSILKTKNARVIAKCPFMAAYAVRHPELSSILDG